MNSDIKTIKTLLNLNLFKPIILENKGFFVDTGVRILQTEKNKSYLNDLLSRNNASLNTLCFVNKKNQHFFLKKELKLPSFDPSPRFWSIWFSVGYGAPSSALNCANSDLKDFLSFINDPS
jgi:hypothetical protein